MGLKPGERIQSTEELAERLRPFVSSARAASLAPQDATRGARSFQLAVGRTSGRDSRTPACRSPGLARSSQAHAAGRTHDRLPPDVTAHTPCCQYTQATYGPRLHASAQRPTVSGAGAGAGLGTARIRPGLQLPARRHARIVATGFGFGMGVILAWSAGLL
jgi:hypothetical protein